MDTINLAPTPEGYANIVATFSASILRDVKANRQADSKVLMRSLIETVAYLGAIGRNDLIKSLMDDLSS